MSINPIYQLPSPLVPDDKVDRVAKQPVHRPLVIASSEDPPRWLVIDKSNIDWPVYPWEKWRTAVYDARLSAREAATRHAA